MPDFNITCYVSIRQDKNKIKNKIMNHKIHANWEGKQKSSHGDTVRYVYNFKHI